MVILQRSEVFRGAKRPGHRNPETGNRQFFAGLRASGAARAASENFAL